MNRKTRQATYRREKKILQRYRELFLNNGFRTSIPSGLFPSNGASFDDNRLEEDNLPESSESDDGEDGDDTDEDDDNDMDNNIDVSNSVTNEDDDDYVDNNIDVFNSVTNDHDDSDVDNDIDVSESNTNENDDNNENDENYFDIDGAENEKHVPFKINDALDWNIPLTAKLQVTTTDHLLAVMTLAERHKLSYEATLDILRWLSQSHENNYLPNTKDTLWKVLCRNTTSTKRHYYCRKCNEYLGNTVETRCQCLACGPDERKTFLGYFLQLDIYSQINQFLSIPNIHKSLQYRFTRQKRRIDALEDIYDGEAYKRLCQNFLSNPNNFSLTFNTDGCKISNSSNTSAWPIYVQINELPPHMRKRHMIRAGIYVDDKHPLLNQFLNPFIKDLQQLFNHGILWKTSEGVEVTSKFVVVIGCVDSPARASLLRMTQFNGRYGCLHCYAEDYSCRPGKYVYSVDQSFQRLRTNEEVRTDMYRAHRTETTMRGLKGISCMTALPLYNLCDGTVVDAMHAALLGAAKQHTRLTMEVPGKPYYVGSPNDLRLIDEVLLSIRPPTRRSRATRSITSWKQWKASEWRNWLGYAPACLETVLDVKYIKHIALLSEAFHYLNSESITPAALERAEHLLEKYVQQFEEIFGVDNMTFNIHL